MPDRGEHIEARRGYELWAPSYPPRAHNLLMELEERAVLGLLPDPRGRTSLDLACGSGRYGVHLARAGARLVVGADFSTAMLARAREEGSGPVVAASLLDLPFCDEGFDLVVCGLAVGHVADLPGCLAEAARVLRPGGSLVYSDFHPRAAALGMQRTFTDRLGNRWTLDHHAHPLEAHLAAAEAAGMRVTGQLEPALSAAGSVGETAGPPGWVDGCPVVLVLRADKLG
jgi:ubiquinone/menaquinone biosynthesis C-methylase UbiE